MRSINSLGDWAKASHTQHTRVGQAKAGSICAGAVQTPTPAWTSLKVDGHAHVGSKTKHHAVPKDPAADDEGHERLRTPDDLSANNPPS